MMPSALLKSTEDLSRMASAGAALAKTFRVLQKAVVPGVTPRALDRIARDTLASLGVEAAFLNYAPPGERRKYPAALCVSVNDAVVHGIPDDAPLMEGDIVSLDFGVRAEGFYADSAITLPVGSVSPERQRLLAVTAEALRRGIAVAHPGARTGDIGHAIQTYVEAEGFGVIRDLVGHGIGRDLHEPPQVPNFGKAGTGDLLVQGMVIAIEPMVSAGSWRVGVDADGWTYRTADGSPAAHFEHTVAITKRGPRILTA